MLNENKRFICARYHYFYYHRYICRFRHTNNTAYKSYRHHQVKHGFLCLSIEYDALGYLSRKLNKHGKDLTRYRHWPLSLLANKYDLGWTCSMWINVELITLGKLLFDNLILYINILNMEDYICDEVLLTFCVL